jgi:SAM-dependent methyltransferase
MRMEFTDAVLQQLLQEGMLRQSDSIVAVCAGVCDRDVFVRCGFRDVLITNINEADSRDESAPFEWEHQDAQDLDLEDESFDFAFVADGLHHCSSPHRALLEMYRVARRGIIVIESRDSFLMRTANRLGLSPLYEVEAVVGSDFRGGGVDDTDVPNFIYRWTEADFKKTVRSFDPRGRHTFRFFYGLNLPYELAGWKKSSLKLKVVKITDPVLRQLTRVFKKQCNTMALVALKPQVPDDLWPWLTVEDGTVGFAREYAGKHFKEIEGSRLSARPREEAKK